MIPPAVSRVAIGRIGSDGGQVRNRGLLPVKGRLKAYDSGNGQSRDVGDGNLCVLVALVCGVICQGLPKPVNIDAATATAGTAFAASGKVTLRPEARAHKLHTLGGAVVFQVHAVSKDEPGTLEIIRGLDKAGSSKVPEATYVLGGLLRTHDPGASDIHIGQIGEGKLSVLCPFGDSDFGEGRMVPRGNRRVADSDGKIVNRGDFP